MFKKARLNVKNKSNSVILAKIPKYLGEALMKIKEDTIIGTLDVLDTGKIEIKISDVLREFSIPLQHNIQVKEGNCETYAVNSKFEVYGKMIKEYQVLPVINDEYLQYKKRVFNAVEKDVKHTKLVQYNDMNLKKEKFLSLKKQEISNNEKRSLLYSKRRERLEKSDALDLIFRAYEKFEAWTVKDLANFTGQPVAYIQEIIKEVAELNKKDHKNTYSLKPEYK